MDIHFKSKKLQRIFAREEELNKCFGKNRARSIMRGRYFLEAAVNLAQVTSMPPMRLHELKGKRKGQFAVDVGPNWRIIFEPVIRPAPTREDGGLDLRQITAIRILGVIDYH